MSYGQLPPGPVNPRLIDAMVAGSQKSTLTAYMYWHFGGGLGIHNFYLGKPVLGALQASTVPSCLVLLSIAKWLGTDTTSALVLAVLAAAVFGGLILSLLFDAFLIPSRVRAYSDRLRAQLEGEADWQAA